MWKIAVGFIAFAVLAKWVIVKGGDGLDMSGEKHEAAAHSPPTAAVVGATATASAAASASAKSH